MGALVWTAAAFAGVIDWQEPKWIAGDEDVATNGRPVYAYTCSDQVSGQYVPLHGVRFNRLNGEGSRFGAEAEVLSGNRHPGVNWNGGVVAGEGVSETYSKALVRVMCSAGHSTMTLRLKRLVPGRRYAVQLWFSCQGVDAMDDKTQLVDGRVTMQGCRGTRPGQHLLGTFTATDEHQDITLAPEPTAWSAVNMFQVRSLDDDPIAWEKPANIVDASDVRTEGRPVFAYSVHNQPCVLNGVAFCGEPGGGGSSCYPKCGGADVPEYASLVMTGARHDAFLASSDTDHSDYVEMLKGGMYQDEKPFDHTLRGLTPGHSYLVQFWVNDSRVGPSGSWAHRTVSVNGSEPARYCGKDGGPYGQYLVGRFTATAPELVLRCVPGNDGSPSGGISAQMNALQLRDITTGEVRWEASRELTGDPAADLDAEGDLRYAWCYGSAAAAYGDVTFESIRASASTFKDDAEINGLSSTYDGTGNGGMVPSATAENGYEHAAAIKAVLGSCCYGSQHGSVSVKLKRLVPGLRYRVQFLMADTRGATGRQDFCLDGVCRVPVAYSSGAAAKPGRSAVGEFTATETTREIRITTFGQANSIHLQAFQVRCVGAPANDVQQPSGEIVSSVDETDVATEGAFVEALAAEPLTVNGVAFAEAGTAWNSAHFGVPDGFAFAGRVRSTYYTDAGTAYGKLIGGGFYRDSYNPFVLTLKDLQPGHTYLLQLWQCDARSSFGTRSSSIGDFGGRTYVGANGKGWYALIRFTAVTTTWPLEIRSANLQINALQLRDLGVQGDLTAWSGTKTLEDDTAVGHVHVVDGPLTVAGPGALDMAGEFVGGDCLVTAPWTRNVLYRNNAGTTTLGAAPDHPLDLVATGRGCIGVAAGVTVAASLLKGDGTWTGPGEIAYDVPGCASFAGRLADGIAVTKAGAGELRIAGAQAGVATLAAPAGALRLTEGLFTGDFTLDAANPVSLTGVSFGDGAVLRLRNGTSLTVDVPTALANLTLEVADPGLHLKKTGAPIIVYDASACSGQPAFTFADGSYVAEVDDSDPARCAVYAAFLGASVIFIR